VGIIYRVIIYVCMCVYVHRYEANCTGGDLRTFFCVVGYHWAESQQTENAMKYLAIHDDLR